MKHKYTGSTSAALIVFLVSGISASVLGVRQFDKHTTHEVLGISGNWDKGTSISQPMIKKVRVDKDISGVTDSRKLLGKQLTKNKKDGEVIHLNELTMPKKSWLAQKVPEGKVLYTLRPKLGSIPFSQLRNGDFFDVLVSGKNGVRTAAKNVLLIGALSGKDSSSNNQVKSLRLSGLKKNQNQKPKSTSLVVAVSPEEVYPLAHILPREIVSIVLHGEKAATSSEQLSIVPKPTQRQIEVISGPNRKMVRINI